LINENVVLEMIGEILSAPSEEGMKAFIPQLIGHHFTRGKGIEGDLARLTLYKGVYRSTDNPATVAGDVAGVARAIGRCRGFGIALSGDGTDFKLTRRENTDAVRYFGEG
jgi:hypothetical protein